MNYLREHYEDAAGLGTAAKISVTAPATTGGIDAQLAPGAQILGHVIDVRNDGPAFDVMVCAFAQKPGEHEECDWSDAAGNYALRGLPGATYFVAFEPENYPSGMFAQQWWQGVSFPAEATPIAIAPPETRAGIDGQVEAPYWSPPNTNEQLLAPPLALLPTEKKPPRKCKKGFRRKLVKGKRRCVRKRRHQRHRRAHRRPPRSNGSEGD